MAILEGDGYDSENTARSTDTLRRKRPISREQLIFLLNEDLAGVSSIISYWFTLKFSKARPIWPLPKSSKRMPRRNLSTPGDCQQIDYLGGTPAIEPVPVKCPTRNQELLQLDLANEMKPFAITESVSFNAKRWANSRWRAYPRDPRQEQETNLTWRQPGQGRRAGCIAKNGVEGRRGRVRREID